MKNLTMFHKLMAILGTRNSKIIRKEDGSIIRLSCGSDEYGDYARIEQEIEDNKLKVQTFYKSDVVLITYRNNYLRKG